MLNSCYNNPVDYFQAIIFSLVEGLTEFLPISSTGHLILTAKLLNIQQSEFVKSFEIIIQLGAIAAIVFLYFKKLTTSIKVIERVFIAFLPTIVIGFTVYKIVKDILLENPMVTVVSLLVGGIALTILELVYIEKEHHADALEYITRKQAFIIGLTQSISMIPGVSRAAATIVGGLFVGLKRKTAVEFSFLLAVPTMLAASTLDVVQSEFDFKTNELTLLTIGFIGSFIVAIFAVKFLLKFIQTHTFIPFGIYRIVIAILFWIFVLQ